MLKSKFAVGDLVKVKDLNGVYTILEIEELEEEVLFTLEACPKIKVAEFFLEKFNISHDDMGTYYEH